MSLPLSGQLGSAQLGAAELGSFQTVTTGAGFFPFFPDVGPVKQEQKKKRKPKVKKPRKPKRVKIKAALTSPVEAGSSTPVLDTRGATTVPRELRQPQAPNTAIALALQEELYRQARLRETITEEDELLLLLC